MRFSQFAAQAYNTSIAFVSKVSTRLDIWLFLLELGLIYLAASTSGESDNGNKKKREGSSKNEKHGDGGRGETKAEKHIRELEKLLENATKKEAKKIKQKIKNIKESAAKKKKGEEHSRDKKR